MRAILAIFSLLFVSALHGQIDTSKVSVAGLVLQENGMPVGNVIIINKRLKQGAFGKSDGTFRIECRRSDTLSITSLGYLSRSISFSDSIPKALYTPTVFLDQRVYDLPAVEIFAPRDLEQIQADIMKLGYNEKDFMLSGLNAAASPITFLYQQFSKRERSKREAAQLWNEDRKRELLKELFHHYVDYEIITLNEEEFDEFIDFLNVSDDFMKYSSQYDFLIFVRDRFKDYKNWKRQQRLHDNDYNYDKD